MWVCLHVCIPLKELLEEATQKLRGKHCCVGSEGSLSLWLRLFGVPSAIWPIVTALIDREREVAAGAYMACLSVVSDGPLRDSCLGCLSFPNSKARHVPPVAQWHEVSGD